MRAANRIAYMHNKFGTAEGKCKDCPNLVRLNCGTKIAKKCRVYGISHSVATDWNSGFDACGLFGKKQPPSNLYLENRAIRRAYWQAYWEAQEQLSIDLGEHTNEP